MNEIIPLNSSSIMDGVEWKISNENWLTKCIDDPSFSIFNRNTFSCQFIYIVAQSLRGYLNSIATIYLLCKRCREKKIKIDKSIQSEIRKTSFLWSARTDKWLSTPNIFVNFISWIINMQQQQSHVNELRFPLETHFEFGIKEQFRYTFSSPYRAQSHFLSCFFRGTFYCSSRLRLMDPKCSIIELKMKMKINKNFPLHFFGLVPLSLMLNSSSDWGRSSERRGVFPFHLQFSCPTFCDLFPVLFLLQLCVCCRTNTREKSNFTQWKRKDHKKIFFFFSFTKIVEHMRTYTLCKLPTNILSIFHLTKERKKREKFSIFSFNVDDDS